MKILNNRGPNIDPWGMPHVISLLISDIAQPSPSYSVTAVCRLNGRRQLKLDLAYVTPLQCHLLFIFYIFSFNTHS